MSLDGRIYQVLSRLYSLIVLNILFLVASVPIVTIPASTGALFAVSRKIVQGEELVLLTAFSKAFASNFKQSLFVGVAFGVFAWIWWVDCQSVTSLHLPFGSVSVVILSVIGASTLLHVLPLMVHVEMKTGPLLMSGLRLGFYRPHLTLLNIGALVLLGYVSLHFPPLLFALFFSLSSILTYWLVDKKMKVVYGDRMFTTHRSGAEA